MANGVSKEIDDMLGALTVSEPESEPEPTLVPEPVSEPTLEPEPEPSPKPVPEPIPEPASEPKPEPEPHEETTEEKLARLEAQNAKLMEWNERILSGEPIQSVTPKPVVVEPKPGEPIPEPAPGPELPKPIEISEINFLEGKTQEEVERIVENPAELNKVLNQVYLKAIEQSIPMAQERTLLSVPEIVVSHVRRQIAFQGLVKDFYDANTDLVPVRRSVQMVANEVHSENPDWTVDKVFTEAAVRTRKVLGMPIPKAGTKPKPGGSVTEPINDPAFVKTRGSRQRGGDAKLTGMAKEIDDLITFD